MDPGIFSGKENYAYTKAVDIAYPFQPEKEPAVLYPWNELRRRLAARLATP